MNMLLSGSHRSCQLACGDWSSLGPSKAGQTLPPLCFFCSSFFFSFQPVQPGSVYSLLLEFSLTDCREALSHPPPSASSSGELLQCNQSCGGVQHYITAGPRFSYPDSSTPSMAQRPSTTALVLPELLSHILSFSGKTTLAAAARVNKLWFRCSIPGLYSGFGDYCGLVAAVADLERRQLYASCLNTLWFFANNLNKCHDALKDMHFPRVDHIRMEHDKGSEPLAHYLTPSVFTLEFRQVELDDNDVSIISNVVQHVRCLTLADSAWSASGGAMSRLLANCRSLESLRLEEMHDRFDGDFMAVAAALPSLKSLTGDPPLTELFARRAFESVSEPFKSLQTLNVDVDPAIVPVLLQNLPNLENLQLHLTKDVFPDLRAISAVRKLRCFHLYMSHMPPATTEQVMPLRSLSNLARLIMISRDETMRHVNFLDPSLPTEEDLKSLFSNMPHLKHLEWNVLGLTTVALLPSLAKACPGLRHCEFSCMIMELDALATLEPLAPTERFCQVLRVHTCTRPAGVDEETAT